MKKYLLATCLMAFTVPTAVKAADIADYEPPAPSVESVVSTPDFSWVGGYIGAQIGGTWSSTDVGASYYNTVNPAFSGSIFHHALDVNGFSGGFYLGYNFDIGDPSGLIVGVETDFSWGSLDKKTPYRIYDMAPYGVAGTDFVVRSRVDQKWDGATRVRVAFAADRWLPYIAAGVAYAQVKSGLDGWAEVGGVPIGPEEHISNSSTFTGWTIGTGSDYAMTDNLLLRFEYRYSDYDDKTYTYDEGTDSSSYTVDHKTHNMRVGVAYKF